MTKSDAVGVGILYLKNGAKVGSVYVDNFVIVSHKCQGMLHQHNTVLSLSC
jgi:hypothetical protein